MPLYEYECQSCAKRFERIQKFSDPPVDICPDCGGAVKKLLSSPAIQFKGSGFYITDYARKDGGSKAAEGKSGDSKGSSSDKGQSGKSADTSSSSSESSSSSSAGSSRSSDSSGSSSSSGDSGSKASGSGDTARPPTKS